MASTGNPSRRALRAAWLIMFNQGGWWTSAELKDELTKLGNLGEKHCYASVISATLSTGALRNYLAVKPADAGKYGNQYAVLPTCHVPRCVTVGEVLK